MLKKPAAKIMLIIFSTILVKKSISAHVNFNDKTFDNARFVEVNSLPAVREHLTPKLYFDEPFSHSVTEPTLVRNNQNSGFKIFNLTIINSIILNFQAVSDNQVINKSYVDHFHQEKERSLRDDVLDFHEESSDMVKNNQDNSFSENKLTN